MASLVSKVRLIAQPQRVGVHSIEVPVEQVRRSLGLAGIGGDPKPPDRLGHDLRPAHEPGHSITAAGHVVGLYTQNRTFEAT